MVTWLSEGGKQPLSIDDWKSHGCILASSCQRGTCDSRTIHTHGAQPLMCCSLYTATDVLLTEGRISSDETRKEVNSNEETIHQSDSTINHQTVRDTLILD